MAQQIGVVGMDVMGSNLALNIESKGFTVAVFNRTAEKTKKFVETKGAGKNLLATYTIEEFVKALETPRRILLMVKAGAPVDEMIQQIKPHLQQGDMLIDGGNSFYKDTARRGKELEQSGLMYIGTGVSGGEEGALKGPCIMPGGQAEAYKLVEPILTKISAQVDDGPCCSYIGPGAAGHYVKMVHNGIEYGDMQLIAEAYDLMKNAAGMTAPEMSKVFGEWNEAELSSYLIEITRDCLAKMDPETGKPIVDLIVDKAEQKGTGKWTSQDALDVGVPIPTINSAVEGRLLSAFRDERIAASKVIPAPPAKSKVAKAKLVKAVREALYAAKICSYAQGMSLLRAASKEYQFGLKFAELARIWKGGCIIRAKLLDQIKNAFLRNPDVPNLLVDPEFCKAVTERQEGWRFAVTTAVSMGIPYLAHSASLAYFDSYRRERLPQNLTQAQRDYFGAHTYERTAQPRGKFFHIDWPEPTRPQLAM